MKKIPQLAVATLAVAGFTFGVLHVANRKKDQPIILPAILSLSIQQEISQRKLSIAEEIKASCEISFSCKEAIQAIIERTKLQYTDLIRREADKNKQKKLFQEWATVDEQIDYTLHAMPLEKYSKDILTIQLKHSAMQRRLLSEYQSE